jgi:hypothetical protein
MAEEGGLIGYGARLHLIKGHPAFRLEDRAAQSPREHCSENASVHNRPDGTQRVVFSNLSPKIDVAEKRPRPLVPASHDSVPEAARKDRITS